MNKLNFIFMMIAAAGFGTSLHSAPARADLTHRDCVQTSTGDFLCDTVEAAQPAPPEQEKKPQTPVVHDSPSPAASASSSSPPPRRAKDRMHRWIGHTRIPAFVWIHADDEPETSALPPQSEPSDLPPIEEPSSSGDRSRSLDSATCSNMDGFEAFKKHVASREGYKLEVYEDSLGKPTVGYGHLVLPGDNLKTGDKITADQADEFFEKDGAEAWNAAQNQATEAGLDDHGCFIVALAAVNYQLGVNWTGKFPSVWSKIKQGQYNDAASSLNQTIWKKQTPIRVKDFQAALLQVRSTTI